MVWIMKDMDGIYGIYIKFAIENIEYLTYYTLKI